MSFTKSVVFLLSAFTCVQALATPHAIRNAHHHRAVAARVAQPSPDIFVPTVVPKKRDLRRRSCKPRPSNSTSTASSSFASSFVAPSSTFSSSSSSFSSSSTPVVPVNVGSLSSSSSSRTHTEAPTSSASSFSSSDSPVPTPTPTPTSTPTPTPSTSSAAQASSSSSSSSSDSSSSSASGYYSGENSGQGTFYETGLGACGITNTDSQHIVAVSHILFDSYPGYDGGDSNSNPVCNQQITATYQGKSVQVTVTDRCVGCAATDLDFSPSAFNELADPSLGRIDIQWQWS